MVSSWANKTSLLLNGNGTNGGQNNTFVDSSSNNLSITRNGNVTQGSFSPFSPVGWSGSFNGSTDYLTATQPSLTGNFTVEGWINSTTSSNQGIVHFNASVSTGAGIHIWKTAANQLMVDDGVSAQAAFTTTLFTNNAWNHFAVVRIGTTTFGYINGVLVGSNSFTPAGNARVVIGRYDGAIYYFNGQISNLRVVNGTAVYTANFTPPTAPLTAIAGTSLLTLQDNRFKDNSTNNFTLTAVGTPKVVASSPFTPAAAYSLATHGGSMYFDGVGDYLTSTTNSAFGLGTGDFSIEYWHYPTRNVGNEVHIDLRTADLAMPLNIGKSSSGAVRSYDGTTIRTGGTMILGTWNHIAWVRQGTTNNLYLNGVVVITFVNGFDVTSSRPLTIGANVVSSAENAQGYISDLRVIKGTALYTSAFTPPTAPLTAVANTQLLLSAKNASIYDVAAKNVLETVGTARIDTTTKKFGTGSMYFNGTSDYIKLPASSDFSFGTGDFTVEAWVYPTNITQRGVIAGNRNGIGANEWLFQYYSSKIYFGTGATDLLISPITLVSNTWYHVAVVRSGTTLSLFENGVRTISTTNSTDFSSVYVLGIGSLNNGQYFHTGYIDDLRITKAAVYTSTFTPPALESSTKTDANDPWFSQVSLELQANPVQVTTTPWDNNTILDSSINGNTLTKTGTPTQGTFSPFSNSGWSGYFDGSSYLTTPSNSALTLNTGDFTFEAWINPSIAYGTLTRIFSGNTGGICIFPNSSNKMVYGLYGSQTITSVASIPLNVWTHIAICRTSGSSTMYINGIADTTITDLSNFTSSTFLIGTDNGVNKFTGYVSNLRVVKGTAVYTTAFTSPTAPLTAISGTSLLTLQDNRFKDNSTNNFALTVTGTPKVQPVSPFAATTYSPSVNGGSVYLNGTTDYISAPSSVNQFGTGDFTVESWSYLISRPGAYPVIMYAAPMVVYAGHNLSNANAYIVYLGGYAITSSVPLIFNAWTHLAVTRSGTSLKLFVNGVQSGPTVTDSTNFNNALGSSIGTQLDGTANKCNCYVTDFRVTKSVLYTTAFTPPTAPLSPVTGTTLLVNGTNSGVIDSTGKNVLQTVGTAQAQYGVSAVDPVGQYSGYFNGSTDYLAIPYSSTLNVDSTSNFSIECWFNTNSTANQTLLCMRDANGGTSGYELGVIGQKIVFGWDPNTKTNLTGNATIPTSVWVHIAVTYDGTTLRVFKDGVLDVSATSINTTTVSGSTLKIGVTKVSGGSNRWSSGSISNLRIIKGTAVYTANFTVPTSPLTAISGTSLLCLQDNIFKDNSTNNFALTVTGTPKIQNANPFSTTYGSALKFNGSTDYLAVPTSDNFTFGTGDFTIEAWFNSASIASAQSIYGGQVSGYTETPEIYIQTSRLFFSRSSANPIQGTTTLLSNTWYHVALVRNAGVAKMYLNGVQEGSTYTDTNNYIGNVNRPLIGGYGPGNGTQPFNGYIDDLRVTKGIARYTTTFTPPTSLADNSVGDSLFNNTSLLLKADRQSSTYYVGQNNQFVDSSVNALTITRNGNTTQGSFSPFSPNGWSASLSSTSDWLTLPANAAFDLTAVDFTVEAWINMSVYNGMAGSGSIIVTNLTSANGWAFGLDGIGTITGVTFTTYISSVGTRAATTLINASNFLLNVWNHLAVVKSGSNVYFYLNGVNYGGAIAASTATSAGGNLAIGTYQQNATYRGTPVWKMSNLRIVKGTAVYASAFTPPTAPLTSISGTSLLTFQDNRFKDNSVINSSFTITGAPKVVNQSPFAVIIAYSPALHGGSAYFDGTGDYLSVNNSLMTLSDGTGNYTWEMWIYPTTSTLSSANQYLLDHATNSGVLQLYNGRFRYYGSAIFDSTTSVYPFIWTHIAATRVGTAVTLYINGVASGSGTDTTNYSAATTVSVGQCGAGNTYYMGYISDLKFTKGTALYTTAFTPPAAPLTPIASTSLLLGMNNAGIYDASSHLPVETMGTAKLSNGQSKFGGSSMYFDGSAGCYMKLPAGSLNLGANDFTIDFWYYKTAQAPAYGRLFQNVDGDIVSSIALGDNSGSLSLNISRDGSNWDGSVGSANAGTLTLATWHHIVFRRAGNTFSLYLNGVQVYISLISSAPYALSYSSTHTPCIGGQSSGRTISGYIDDFRITIGKGRYTVEPTAELTL